METTRDRRRPWGLTYAAASLLLGVLVAESLWTPPGTEPFGESTGVCLSDAGLCLRILLGVGSVAAATLGMGVAHRWTASLIFLGIGVLGFLRAESSQRRWEWEFASLKGQRSERLWARGQVTGRRRETPWGSWATARLDLPGRPRVRLVWNDAWHPLPGDLFEGACRLRSLDPPSFPGRWDPRLRGRRGGTGGEVHPLCLYKSDVSVRGLPALLRKAERSIVVAGDGLERRFHQRLSPPAARFLSAFLLGRRDLLERSRVESFRQTGIAHLLAISGLHVGFVALSVSPLLGLVGGRRRLRICGWVLFLVPFALLTGGAAPVWRASLMILCHQVGLLRGSRDGALAGWLLGAACEGWFRPSSILGPSFTLSYGATLALILSARRGWLGFLSFGAGGSSHGSGLWRRARRVAVSYASLLWETARASAVVLLITSPLLLAHFGRWLPMAVVHNVLLVPAAGFLLPSALGCLALSLLPGGPGECVWSVLDCMTTAFLALQDAATSVIPNAEVRAVLPVSTAIVLTLGLCALLMRGPWPRRGAWILCTLLSLMAGREITKAPDGTWSATFLSVGRGESILLRWPGGRSWLVDTGSPGRRPGESSLASALRHLGVRSLDRVFVTHRHSDHEGGLDGLGGSMEVETLCVGPGEGGRYSSRRGIREVEEVWDECSWRPAGGIEARAVHPPRKHDLGANDGSVVLHIRGFGMSLLLAGDVEGRGEEMMALRSPGLASLVLKVPHHGRATSSASSFLQRVRPAVGIILGDNGDDADARSRLAGEGIVVAEASTTGPLWVGVEGREWVIKSLYQKGRIVLGPLKRWRAPIPLPLACGGDLRVL